MATDIESAAIAKFGVPNKSRSSAKELRFGNKGSVSVVLSTGEWYDHENGVGGAFKQDANVAPVKQKGPRMIVKKYDYVNADGELRYQVQRYCPKFFTPRAWIDGKWRTGIGCMTDVERLPYRLPEMLKSDYVIVVEGEKDADALRAVGLVATTKSGGIAAKWEPSALRHFSNRDVYVIADNDDAGIDGARKTCTVVAQYARSVRFCHICKTLPPRADVSDWLAAGNENLLAVCKEFPLFEDEPLDENFVYDTLDADDITPVLSADDFVESTLIAGAMSVVYGPSNVGKTFFASDLALHVALGRKWRDREVDQAPVLFVAAEGSYGIRNRVAAFRAEMDVPEKMPFHVIAVAVNMLNDDEAVERLINTAKVKGARLIVLDTLARVMAGGNENAPDDMGQLIGNCDRLRQESGSHVMLVHHTGKDEARGARGHSSLRAATDTEIEVSGGNGLSFAKVTKQRELEIEGEFAFSLHVVSLGVDKRGKEVTSCVVVPEEATKKVRPKRPNGPVKRTVLKALQNAIIDHGKNVNDARGRIVDEDVWREAAFVMMTGKQNHKWTSFRRAADGLVGDEFVGFRDDKAWLLD